MSNEFRSIFMPYCLILNESGKYTITNRNYKPLGFADGFFNYDNYSVKITGLNAATILKISFDKNPDPTRIYLYNDSCTPTQSKKAMDDYLAKLAVLSKLKIE